MLSEEKIMEVVREASRGSATRRDGSTSVRIARAIEAAVLAEQAKAVPVCYLLENAPGQYAQASEEFAGDADVFPVFRHPAPAPEGMVMVPMEPSVAMREALQVGTGVSFLETRAVYLRLIAAAEKEAGE